MPATQTNTTAKAKVSKAKPIASAPKAKLVKRSPIDRREREAALVEKAAEKKQLQTLQADAITQSTKQAKPTAMQFAVQQLSTPPAALDAFNKELEELRAKHGITNAVKVLKAKPEKAPRAERIQQNGITRPDANTLCGLIWAKCDAITQKLGAPAPISALKQEEDLLDVNNHTIKTQYARWRQFNGIHGRLIN